MPNTPHLLKVFLCHAHADKTAVRSLYRHLKERKIDVWLDAEKLLPGQNWQVEIPKALHSSDVIIICLSKNSVDKEGYVQKEIKFALDKALEMPEGRIFLIPARLEECDLPYSLSAYHFVNLFEGDGYKRLLRSLRVRGEQIGATKVLVNQDTILPHIDKTTREKIEREVVEKADRDIIEEAFREPAIKFAPKKEEQEANAEKIVRMKAARETAEKIEREAAEKAAREKLERAKAEREAQENAKREAASEPKKQKSRKLPIWGVRLTAFAILALVIWGLSSLPASRKATPTPSATQTLFVEPATKTPLPATGTATIVPTPTFGIGSIMKSEKDGATLVYVPKGEFKMGSDNRDSDEKPVHTVYLDAFWIDQTEVTNKQYKACVDAGMCELPSFTS